MSEDPALAGSAPEPPSRLLIFETGAVRPLARALLEAGHSVDTVERPADIAGALSRGGFDAIVLDLSADGAAVQVHRAAGESLDRLGEAPEASRPAVLAVAASPGPDGGVPLRADAYIEARDVAGLLREVRGAIAVRRLARAVAEVERLRQTVLFARHTAHELAQPLTTILARAQLLRTKLKADDPHLRAVNIICEEADRLARLVEEFQKLKVMSRSAAAQG